jgi:hypothetical protein
MKVRGGIFHACVRISKFGHSFEFRHFEFRVSSSLPTALCLLPTLFPWPASAQGISTLRAARLQKSARFAPGLSSRDEGFGVAWAAFPQEAAKNDSPPSSLGRRAASGGRASFWYQTRSACLHMRMNPNRGFLHECTKSFPGESTSTVKNLSDSKRALG